MARCEHSKLDKNEFGWAPGAHVIDVVCLDCGTRIEIHVSKLPAWFVAEIHKLNEDMGGEPGDLPDLHAQWS